MHLPERGQRPLPVAREYLRRRVGTSIPYARLVRENSCDKVWFTLHDPVARIRVGTLCPPRLHTWPSWALPTDKSVLLLGTCPRPALPPKRLCDRPARKAHVGVPRAPSSTHASRIALFPRTRPGVTTEHTCGCGFNGFIHGRNLPRALETDRKTRMESALIRSGGLASSGTAFIHGQPVRKGNARVQTVRVNLVRDLRNPPHCAVSDLVRDLRNPQRDSGLSQRARKTPKLSSKTRAT